MNRDNQYKFNGDYGSNTHPGELCIKPIPVKGDDVKFVAEFLEVLRSLAESEGGQ